MELQCYASPRSPDDVFGDTEPQNVYGGGVDAHAPVSTQWHAKASVVVGAAGLAIILPAL
jgi:hypothetical protein